MSRSTIQVLSKRDPRVEPLAGATIRSQALHGWLQPTQMLEALRLRDRPVTP